jgi:hypothetical protein
MIASEAYQRPPHIYGEILSSYVYQSPRDEVAGIGRFLSQGTAAGAVIYFLIQLTIILLQPPDAYRYNFIYVLLLPFALLWGMLNGLFEGLVIWACTKAVGRRLNVAARVALGIVALVLVLAVFYLFIDIKAIDSSAIAVYLSTGAAYGLLTGSRLQPWRELVRGSTAAKSRILTGITGLALRSLLILGLMESILAIMCTLKDFKQKDIAFAFIALCHFAVASVIVFTRMKFWLLLQLALLVNFPTVLLITEVLKAEPAVYRYLTVSYLTIWAAFLLARWSLTYSALNSLKEELRYYLID